MDVVSPLTPVTEPVAELTVATAVLLLVHVPPGVASLSVIDENIHTLESMGAMICAGNGLTNTDVLVRQPVGSVYVI